MTAPGLTHRLATRADLPELTALMDTAIADPSRLAARVGEAGDGRWPVDVWVSVRLLCERRPEGAAVGAASRGLAPFLGHELAIAPQLGADPGAQLQRLYGVAGWLLGAGPVLGDGHTLGPEGGEVFVASLRRGEGGAPDAYVLHAARRQ
jgi:hypothetical protein